MPSLYWILPQIGVFGEVGGEFMGAIEDIKYA